MTKRSHLWAPVSGSRMPFPSGSPAFKPETLKAMQSAFEMAWSEIATLPIVCTEPDSAREFIAQRIVAAAQEHGEREPEQLKQYALRAFEV